ncbi:hypothetical protein IAD21_03849 [Abditibacteriota bacterium]|nr:hypothetical protein IAD21_03849 [Abditibacteriota bacterium]
MNRALLDLQHLDSSIISLSREKKALDDGTSARQQRDETRALLDAARAEERGVTATLRTREGELEDTETKIARQKARLNTSSNAHDVSALERDIGGLTKKRGDLDETILGLMDEGESLQKRVGELEKELARTEAEVGRVEGEFATSSADLDAQLARKRALRPTLAGKLSPVETEKYVASFKKHSGIGVSEAVKGSCSVCGTTLSRDFLRAAPSEAFPQCESCSRLIFVAG